MQDHKQINFNDLQVFGPECEKQLLSPGQPDSPVNVNVGTERDPLVYCSIHLLSRQLWKLNSDKKENISKPI